MPYLPLTEGGAVVDFVAACTLIHCHSTTVHTHLLQKQEEKKVKISVGVQ